MTTICSVGEAMASSYKSIFMGGPVAGGIHPPLKIFFPFYNVIEDMVDINSVHVLIFSGKNSVDASNEKRSNMKLV